MLGILTFVYALNFLDRQLLSILAKPIQDELGVTDGQLGLLGGLYFALFYCVLGIPVAWLADRTNRMRVLSAACALWSLATIACGMALSYPQLATARMTVGIGEAGGVPPSYSNISDYFGPEARGRALGLFNLAPPLGQAAGVAFGAHIAVAFDWRTAFVALGAVGLLTAAVVFAFVREPRRGAADADHVADPTDTDPPPKLGTTFSLFLRRPVLWLTALASGATQFVTYGILNFATLFLMREKGMTLEQVALWYALLVATALSAGMVVSGWLIDRLRVHSPRWYGGIPGTALALAIPFYVGFVAATDWRLALALLAPVIFLSSFYLTPAVALVQNAVPARERTMAGAILLLVMNLIGLGLGPTFVGAMSDVFARSDPEHSLQLALYLLTPFYLVAGGLFLALAQAH